FLSFSLFLRLSTTDIYTLSLHDALPISFRRAVGGFEPAEIAGIAVVIENRLLVELAQVHHHAARRSRTMRSSSARNAATSMRPRDRKSTRLNSSHVAISYAVFCLKKKIL